MKPKCKLCGSPHWTYEEHKLTGTEELQKVGAAVLRNTVTKLEEPLQKGVPVTKRPGVGESGVGAVGTAVQPDSQQGTADMNSRSVANAQPSRGRPKKHKSNAERQRAYRKRSRG